MKLLTKSFEGLVNRNINKEHNLKYSTVQLRVDEYNSKRLCSTHNKSKELMNEYFIF